MITTLSIINNTSINISRNENNILKHLTKNTNDYLIKKHK